MKVIMNIKCHNKDANAFYKEIEMTPQEYDSLKKIAIEVNQRAGNGCISVYVFRKHMKARLRYSDIISDFTYRPELKAYTCDEDPRDKKMRFEPYVLVEIKQQ